VEVHLSIRQTPFREKEGLSATLAWSTRGLWHLQRAPKAGAENELWA
jgi:hypothetical protein